MDINEDDMKNAIIPQLKKLFLENKRDDALQRALFDIFSQTKNPYSAVLDLIRFSPDYCQQKGVTLCSTILGEFETWRNSHWKEESKKRRLLSLDVRRRAFDICTKKHTHLLAKASETFDLSDIGELFINDIRQKAQAGQHKDAVTCIIALKLQKFFNLNEVLLPCILQDKTNYVEAYVDELPDLQKELIELLDSICVSEVDISTILRTYNITGVQQNTINVKPLAKLIARIMKKYSIPADLAPNFTRTRSEGAMRYLLVRRYIERSIDTANFNDMVYQAHECQPNLGPYMLTYLCDVYRDFNEALKWTYRLAIAETDWPQSLVHYAKTNPVVLNSKIQDGDVEDLPASDEFLKFPLQVEQIFIVDNEQEMEKAVDFLKMAQIVGLDAEYQPNFGQPIERVALFQVATKDKVFLFDIQQLTVNVDEAKLKSVFEQLLTSNDTLKIGFHFGADLKVLALTLPFCSDVLSRMQNTICLAALLSNLRRQDFNFFADEKSPLNEQSQAQVAAADFDENEPVLNVDSIAQLVIDDTDDKQKATLPPTIDSSLTLDAIPVKVHSSLSDVCKFFLGKPLNKNEQISNWSRRPLRQSQVIYAALDAYCLLNLYEMARKRAEDLSLNFTKAFNEALIDSKGKVDDRLSDKKRLKTFKNAGRAEILQLINQINEKKAKDGTCRQDDAEPKKVNSIKVVVDNMLQGLGKQLRRCGIDCKIADNGNASDFVLQTAVKEERLALSCGSSFASLSSKLTPEMCSCVPNSLNSKQQLEWFLLKHNIVVTEKDIFSRCILCNAAEFMVIPSAVFCTLWDSKMAPNDFLDPVPFDKEVSLHRIDECLERLEKEMPSYEPSFFGESWTFIDKNYALHLLSGKLVRLDAPTTQVPVIAKIETVPSRVLFEEKTWFYVCCACGKVYWDGAHMVRYAESLGLETPSDGLSKF